MPTRSHGSFYPFGHTPSLSVGPDTNPIHKLRCTSFSIPGSELISYMGRITEINIGEHVGFDWGFIAFRWQPFNPVVV